MIEKNAAMRIAGLLLAMPAAFAGANTEGAAEPILKWQIGVLLCIVLAIVGLSSYFRQRKRSRQAEREQHHAARLAVDALANDRPAQGADDFRCPPLEVRFQTFSGRHDPLFQGRGTVSVVAGTLFISGRRRRLFSGQRHSEAIDVEQVHDVMVDGRLLSFSVLVDGKPVPRLLVLATPAHARQLAAALPEQRSPEGWQTLADARAFQSFLERAGRPVVSLTIISLNVLVFLLSGARGGWFGGNTGVLVELGGNLAALTTGGQWWRLVSGIFLHAGLLHIALNMWALWDAGRIAERLFGPWRYAALYLGAGLLGSVASINWQQEVVSVGASGAIFGVYGALLVALLLRPDLLPLSIAKALQSSASAMIAYSLFSGFLQTGVDNAAHLGGLLAGVLIGAALVIPWRRSFAAVFVVLTLIGGGALRAVDLAAPYREELSFRQFIAVYGAEEARLNARLQELATQIPEGGEEKFVHALESEIIPGWARQDKAIAGLATLPPRLQAKREALAGFIHLRYESMLLLRDAVRTNDAAKTAAFREKNIAAAALLTELKRLNKQNAKAPGR